MDRLKSLEMDFAIEIAQLDMVKDLTQLYKKVAQVPDGIIRSAEEVTDAFVLGFVKNSIKNGLILVAKVQGKIIGEIHAYTPPIFAFHHLLTDLTIVVHPDHQGKGIGRQLFLEFLEQVKINYPHILRVELFVRAHNHKNVSFYENLGFINEGRQENKIFGLKSLETPIHMAWFNPNFIPSHQHK